jgi:hypothetical protein
MTTEERKLSIEYLEGIKDDYIEHFDINGHEEINAVPEYYAIENAIKALEQQAKITQIIDDCDLEAWEVLEMIKEVMRA